MPHNKEKEAEFDMAPDGLYRGSIKIEESGSIVIDSVNLKHMNLMGTDNKSPIPGFEFEIVKPDPSDIGSTLFYKFLRDNLGYSIQYQFTLTESRHSDMVISGMDGVIFRDDSEENIRLSCSFSEPLDVSSIS